MKNASDFEFGDSDFEDFKKFLKSSGFTYTTATEKELEEMLEKAQEEELRVQINSQIGSIKQEIEKYKTQELSSKKPEIVSLLTDEIIKRYFYKEGLYEYYTENNPEIIKAKEILNDPAAYSSILK